MTYLRIYKMTDELQMAIQTATDQLVTSRFKMPDVPTIKKPPEISIEDVTDICASGELNQIEEQSILGLAS